MDLIIECQGCDKVWRENQVIPLENVPDLLQRIAPGEKVPFGECCACGALCHQVEEAPEAKEEKSELLTLSVEGYFSPREIKAIQSGKAMVFLELEEDATQREFDVDKDSLTSPLSRCREDSTKAHWF